MEKLLFRTDVAPILQANCVNCHGDAPQADLDIRQMDTLLRGGQSGPAVVPANSAASLLYQKIQTGDMPPGMAQLGPDEIEVIRRWIDGGALDGDKMGSLVSAALPSSAREILVPILHVRCVICHGRRRQEGGLDVRTVASLLRGGKSGPAILPGKPDQSPLIQRIAANDMPPPESYSTYCVRPVTTDELTRLKQWIAAGAPAEAARPRPIGGRSEIEVEERQLWSFRTPQRPEPPILSRPARVATPVDAFVLCELRRHGLDFAPPASPLTLMRRVYFDLIGLPPTPAELEEHRADPSEDRYERMIDRLLSSPRYGEHWGRYWLDAAGYADSEGKVHADNIRPFAYRYRDYVIRAFNQDKPYDRFLVEQIAGDELVDYGNRQEVTPIERDYMVATGFLRMSPDGTWSKAQNFIPERLDVVADEVEVVASTLLGLTMNCARCHDHKYDPLPQRDYYRFSAIFRSAYDPYDWFIPQGQLFAGDEAFPRRYLPHVSRQEREQVTQHNAPIQAEIDKLKAELDALAVPLREKARREKVNSIPSQLREDVLDAVNLPQAERTELQKYLLKRFGNLVEVTDDELMDQFPEYAKVKKSVTELEGRLLPAPMIRAAFDVSADPTPVYQLYRGDYRSPGSEVGPGVPSIFNGALAPYRVVKPKWESTGRRLALARWLIQPNHPLTVRVMVNRVWSRHFGRGLVATLGNFGRKGAAPSHPQLLDWLAAEMVGQGWSLKALHRVIMSSAVYRQQSRRADSDRTIDPDNVLLSHFPGRRLSAEALRDSILYTSGRLDQRPFGPADPVEVREDGEVVGECGQRGCRRSIYMLQRRSTPLTMLDSFDAPELNPNCLERTISTVSSQALQMWNSDLVREQARYMAGRVVDRVGSDVGEQVDRVYQLAYSRWPSEPEREKATRQIRKLTRYWREHLNEEIGPEPRKARSRWLALAAYCHVVLNSAEFLHVD